MVWVLINVDVFHSSLTRLKMHTLVLNHTPGCTVTFSVYQLPGSFDCRFPVKTELGLVLTLFFPFLLLLLFEYFFVAGNIFQLPQATLKSK